MLMPSLCFQLHLKAPMILNGVCIRWRGWLDLERLDGVGCLEFDEENAMVEDAKLREQVRIFFLDDGFDVIFCSG